MTLQLKAIYSYIVDNLFNKPAAYRIKFIIENKISTISIFPNSGISIISLNNSISKKYSSVQRAIAANYVILYEYYEEISTIAIRNIFHQMQNYGKIFHK